MNVNALAAVVYARCLVMALWAMDGDVETRTMATQRIRRILTKFSSTMNAEEEIEDVI